MTTEDPLLAALAAARERKARADYDIRLLLAMPAGMCSRAPTGWPTWPTPRACPSLVCAPHTPRPTLTKPPG